MSILCAIIFAIAVISLILTSPVHAQRDLVINLYSQSMFDWYVANPEDRMASAAAIIAQHYMPESKEDFFKFETATTHLVDCINRQTESTDSLPVAIFADICMERIEAQGLLK